MPDSVYRYHWVQLLHSKVVEAAVRGNTPSGGNAPTEPEQTFDGTIPMYRAYNPNAVTGSHHYSSSEEEILGLVSAGWRDKGIGWYGVRQAQ